MNKIDSNFEFLSKKQKYIFWLLLVTPWCKKILEKKIIFQEMVTKYFLIVSMTFVYLKSEKFYIDHENQEIHFFCTKKIFISFNQRLLHGRDFRIFFPFLHQNFINFRNLNTNI